MNFPCGNLQLFTLGLSGLPTDSLSFQWCLIIFNILWCVQLNMQRKEFNVAWSIRGSVLGAEFAHQAVSRRARRLLYTHIKYTFEQPTFWASPVFLGAGQPGWSPSTVWCVVFWLCVRSSHLFGRSACPLAVSLLLEIKPSQLSSSVMVSENPALKFHQNSHQSNDACNCCLL